LLLDSGYWPLMAGYWLLDARYWMKKAQGTGRTVHGLRWKAGNASYLIFL
jgi:hypothetical protein